VLIHLDDPGGIMPWLNWPAWLASNGQPTLKPAGTMRFSLYDQVIQATVAGQGVALGRIPLIAELLNDGRLVAPFPKRYDSPRGYFVVVAPHAGQRPEASAFIDWLRNEATPRAAGAAPAAKRSRPKTRHTPPGAP
jgi:DNA-binding transcriptional LysR family regulator